MYIFDYTNFYTNLKSTDKQIPSYAVAMTQT